MAALGYGLIGAGSFGTFCLEQYGSMEELRPIGVADENPGAARKTAEAGGVEALTVDEMLGRDDIEIVHLATPPFTHRDLVLKAIAAGKHVLCEKPLAVTLADGDEMVQAAQAADRLLAVNLIMRYNPLLEAVKRILDEDLLGRPIRATFENLATDFKLAPSHWFWDPEKSGGIFVEHGVHFFDLFEWFFGPVEVLAAQQSERPGSGVIEAVRATLSYGPVLADHYHGFHQPEHMDRQEMRIVCERGDLRLHEWVPTKMEATLLGTQAEADALAGHLPAVSARSKKGAKSPIKHRFQETTIDGEYRIAGNAGMDKDALYGHVVRELMRDQVAWIRDRSHVRRIDESNALRSLAVAERARELAT
ncbi:Gfo/Idh/MocA family oxidoreductase [bacterium]|nr:MAG: Gfo/Idh/MocA family oxidoreductase [bacterium]